VEFVYEYLHHTILLNLVREINGSSREELGEQKYQEVLKQVLKPFRLTCISISTVSRWMNLLGRERVRKFSRRACQYICAYYKIAKEREGQQVATEATHLDASPIQVEKMVKLFKTHCCAMDFDTHFCKAVFVKQEDQEVSMIESNIVTNSVTNRIVTMSH
jgi:hypothetical protein